MRHARRTLSCLYCILLCFALCTLGCDKSSSVEVKQEVEPAVETSTEEARPKAPEPVVAKKQERPLLWQIDGKKGPVYLLGTIHVGFDAKEKLPAYVWKKLGESKSFYMETDLGKVEMQTAQRSALPEGESLDKMLSKEAWEELDRRMNGVAEQFRSLKPWVIVSMLTMKMLPEGTVTGAPMDQVLHGEAKKRGLKLGYLEEPGYQITVLDETLTLEELEDMLEHFDEQKEDLVKLFEYYNAGDIESMKTVSFKDMDEKPEMYEKLFFKRNEAWVPQIEEELEQGSGAFFAFGAGHLLGERGVLDLLEKKGYKPYRLTADVVEKQKKNEEQVNP